MKIITQITVKNKRRVKKPFFYVEPLNEWEKLLFILYGVFTIVVCFYTNSDGMIIGYGVSIQLAFFWVLYRSLRNLSTYLAWCGFGLIHLVLYFIIKNGAACVFINTIPLLLIFQLLRYLSLKLQYREFLFGKGGEDLFENKKTSVVDFFAFAIYMAAFCGLSILAVKYA